MAKKRGNNEGSIVRRKDGRWMASITIGRDSQTGKLKRACFYGKTRQQAADQLAKALSDLNRGAFVAPHKLTVGQWLKTWLWEYKRPGVRPLTFMSYEALVRCHLQPTLGHIPLRDLRPDQVQGFYNAKRDAGLSPRTVRCLHTVLHGALKQAMKNQLVMRNISEATTLPRKHTRKIRPFTLDEMHRLLTAIQQDRWFPAVLLDLGTGLRRGELLALRWQDIDLQTGLLQVRQSLERVKIHGTTYEGKKTRLLFQEPKTSYGRRTVPIPEDIVEELKRHKARQAQEKLLLGPAYEDHGLVFCHPNGQPIDPKSFSRRFEWMLKSASLPHLRFHDARHTFATLMLELGESPKTVQSMLGHSSIAITLDIYSHVSLDLEKRAAARLNAVFRERAFPGEAAGT
jgi:integrase